MNKAHLKLFVTPLMVVLAFFLGALSVQGENPNNIVPMNDETQACREACGLGEGKPSGDFFGYDSANECLNNCFAAKGIGNVEGTCDPNLADNCCNAFATPGQDPDCFGFNSCFSSLDQFSRCHELGGTFVSDNTCAPFTRHEFVECIEPSSFEPEDCTAVGGTVEQTNQCGSDQGCFMDFTLSGRCKEVLCPNFNDIVRYESVDNITGAATFTNLNDNRKYSCSLLGSQPSFNCTTGPSAGQEVSLITLGLPGGTCEATTFNIGTDNIPNLSLQECSYRCSIQP